MGILAFGRFRKNLVLPRPWAIIPHYGRRVRLEGLVSKETVLQRWWRRETKKSPGFINCRPFVRALRRCDEGLTPKRQLSNSVSTVAN